MYSAGPSHTPAANEKLEDLASKGQEEERAVMALADLVAQISVGAGHSGL